MKRGKYKAGAWLSCCDYCGFTYYASELKKDWKGLYACKDDYSPRNPQDFVRGVKDDPSVPFTNPRSDEFRNPFELILFEDGSRIWFEDNTGFLQQESAG